MSIDPVPEWAQAVPSTPGVHAEPPRSTAWTNLSDSAISGLREQLVGAITRIITQLPKIALGFIRGILGIIDNFQDIVAEIVDMFLGWITAAPELITLIIDTVLTWITEIPDIALAILDAIIQTINDLPEIVEQIVTSFIEIITETPDLVTDIVTTLISWVSDFPSHIEQVITAAITWVTSVPDLAGDILDAIITLIVNAPANAASLIDAAITLIASTPALIVALVAAIGEAILSAIPDAFFGIDGLPLTAFTNFLKLLGGFFPGLLDNSDGTGSPNLLTSITSGDGTALITDALGTVLQVVDGTVQTLQHALSGFLSIFGIHQGTMNAVVNGLQGGAATSASVNDVQIAAQDAADALATNTSQILGLQQGGGGVGTPGGLLSLTDFTDAANAASLGALNFDQTYGAGPGSHYLGVGEGRAVWFPVDTPSPNQYRWGLAVKNDIESTGDNQLVGVAYSSVPEEKTYDYIMGRSNLAGDTYILVTFSAGYMWLSHVVSNSETVMTSRSWTKKSNAAYYLECGPGRVFSIYENTNLILSHTEAGTTSGMGAAYRRAGFGGMANTKVFYWVPFFLRPGRVTAFSIANV